METILKEGSICEVLISGVWYVVLNNSFKYVYLNLGSDDGLTNHSNAVMRFHGFSFRTLSGQLEDVELQGRFETIQAFKTKLPKEEIKPLTTEG